MRAHNENMPQALRELIEATPAQTRGNYTQRRAVGVAAVLAFWGGVAARGVLHGTANVAQVCTWLLFALSGAVCMQFLSARAELRLRLFAMASTAAALALLIGETSEAHMAKLGASCIGIFGLLVTPAIALLVWTWKGSPYAVRPGMRMAQAFGVSLLAGAPLTSFCHIHEAPHLWLTHLAPAAVVAGLVAMLTPRSS